MNDIIIKELISNMSDAELKVLRKKIDATLNGDLNELDVDLSKVDIFETLNDYLEAKSLEGKSEKTIKQYRYLLTSMFIYINKPAEYIRTEDIRSFLNNKKQENGISDLTLDNYRTYINTFFNWLKLNGYVSNNPCLKILPIKYEKKERQPLTAKELMQLRKACSTSRDKAILETLYSTGCRVSELVGIKISDINFDTKEVHLFGKGKKHRTSFLTVRASKALKAYLKDRKGHSEYLFTGERFPYENLTTRTIEKRIKYLGEQAGIVSPVFPHRIRHTVATDALNNGMPIEQVQLFLGHENIATTQIYAKTQKEVLRESHIKYIK